MIPDNEDDYLKQMRKERRKEIWHNTFLVLLIVFSVYAFYFLFYGLIIEPNLPRHIYGPGDFREFIYLLGCLLIVGISYMGIVFVNYKPLKMNLWKNFMLLLSVKFNFVRYRMEKILREDDEG